MHDSTPFHPKPDAPRAARLSAGAVVCLALLGVVAGSFANRSARAEEMEISHTRHRATLVALRQYTPVPYSKPVHEARREMLRALFNLFVHEGGYFPEGAAQALGVEDLRVEETARLFRKLDRERGTTPTPTTDTEHANRPGALLLSLAIALTYSNPSVDGLHAAAHLARLGCDDERTEAVAQACYALASFCLLGGEDEKHILLEKAAANTDDPYLARRIRGIRTTRWDRLPPESTVEGRLLRSLYVWFHQESWTASVRVGRERLRHPESQWFLAAFAAMWYDLPGLPEPLIARMNENHADTECDIRLYRLAETGILLSVPEAILDPPAPRDVHLTSSESDPRGNAERPERPTPPERPAPPVSPTPPQRPTRPSPADRSDHLVVIVEPGADAPPSTPVPPTPHQGRNAPPAPRPAMPERPALAPYPDRPTRPTAPDTPQPPPSVHTDILHEEEPETTSRLAHPGTSQGRSAPRDAARVDPLPLVPAVGDTAMPLPVGTRSF